MYQFPAPDLITMDVVKNDGIEGGGTYVCKDIWSCYKYVMAAEKRGAVLNTVRQSTSERMVEEFGLRDINNG